MCPNITGRYTMNIMWPIIIVGYMIIIRVNYNYLISVLLFCQLTCKSVIIERKKNKTKSRTKFI